MRDSASRPRICFWVRFTVRSSAMPRSMDNCLMKNIASSLFCDNSVMTAVIGIRQTNEGSNAQAAVT
eukprot:1368581-Prorocentrum_lima.AAC.1